MVRNIPPYILVGAALFTISFLVLPLTGKVDVFPFYRWDHFTIPGFEGGKMRFQILEVEPRGMAMVDTLVVARTLESHATFWQRKNRSLVDPAVFSSLPADLPNLDRIRARYRLRTIERLEGSAGLARREESGFFLFQRGHNPEISIIPDARQ